MKQVLALAALVACSQASLFVQQADNSAQQYYFPGVNVAVGGNALGTANPFTNAGPLSYAQYTDSVQWGSASPNYLNAGAYPVYGLRYYQGVTRRFAPAGNWLMVTDPISNNYGDHNAPIFSITVNSALSAGLGGYTAGTNFADVQIPRNPFATFHAVVISAGPATQWTSPGDIVIFQPNPATNKTLSSYNPLDIFGLNLGSGSNSLQNFIAGTTTQLPNIDGWICLGWNVLTLNLAADQQQYFDILDETYRARGAYCLVPESSVVAKVDLSPGAAYPWPQRSLVNRLSALSSEPSEFGFVGLA